MDKKPMMWMGKVSAWAALAMGIVTLAAAAWSLLAYDALQWIPLLGTVLLLVGAYRTLKRMSGGLRLLCGAWGLVAGMYLVHSASAAIFLMSPGASIEPAVGVWLVYAATLIALAGLALTVLHKEK